MGNAKFSYKITFIMKNRNRKNSFASLMKEDVGLKDPSWGKHLIVKWLLKSRKTFSQEKLRTGQIKVHSNNLNLFKRHPKNSNSHFGRSCKDFFVTHYKKIRILFEIKSINISSNYPKALVLLYLGNGKPTF